MAMPAVPLRLRRYFVFTVFESFFLWMPFWNLWLFRTADYFEATLIDVVFWTTGFLVLMPAGVFADRYGRKPAISVGTAVWTAGIVVWGLSTQLWMFAVSSVIWALGAGFVWNTGSAYLYDTLAEEGQEDTYPYVIARATMLSLLATGAASAVGGTIIAVTGALNATLLLYGVPGVIAFLLTFTFHEPRVHRAPSPQMLTQIRRGLRTMRASPAIVIVTAFQVVISVVTYVMMFFRPAFVEAIVQGNFWLMGLGYAGFFAVGAIAGRSMGHVLERLGESGSLVLSYLLVFVPFILVYAISAGFFDPATALVLGLVTQASFYIFAGVEGPVVTTIINRRIPSSERVTILAITTFFTTLTIAIFEPLVGFLALRSNIGTGLTAVAAIAAVPCAYLLVAYRRTGQAKAAPPVTAAHLAADGANTRKP